MKIISIIMGGVMMALVAYGSYSFLNTKKSKDQIDFSTLTVDETMKIYNCKTGDDCLIDRYSACSKNDQCVLVSGPCAWDVEAVNEQYEAEASAYFAHQGTFVDCADKPDQWKRPSAALCKLKKCEPAS
jgi:hypothetical protein